MCGIVGVVGASGAVSEPMLLAMADGIKHRGPDDRGVWCDAEQGIGLAQRRLSILDLSPAGHQPMMSACGRYVIVFNGEIYNHAVIRKELEDKGYAPAWRGHSDTEVLLAALIAFGAEETLKRCVGMYAFALWDKRERTLVMARDRMGEKPLYYGQVGSSFVFASELKAFYRHPQWYGEIDRRSLALMMRHNYIPAPYSIFKNVAKLPPATVLYYGGNDKTPRLKKYWDVREAALKGQANPFTGTAEEAVNQTEALLRQALEGQMMADVPLGAFLSGGIDSSTIVALMQSMSSQPVRTFSIGFGEKDYNEAVYAKAVAQHLGTQHTEMYVTPKEAMGVIPLLPTLYCEPFSDSSQIPTYIVSGLARKHVTVSLSGDAGDELFSGYLRYALADKIWSRVSMMPQPVRQAFAKMITAVPPEHINKVAGFFLAVLAERVRPKNVGDRAHKLAGVLALPAVDELYRSLISHWKDTAEIVIGGDEYPTPLAEPFSALGLNDPIKSMMCLDQIGYLPDDILVKVDRASMGVSLESRVPLLDHRIVEFSWTLPLSILRCGGQSKWPLRQILYRHVPRELVERPKVGFGIPLDAWLRGPLKDWAEALLDETRMKQEGFFHPAPIRQAWAEHLSGSRNWQYHLWDVLMFQGWLEHYKSGAIA